MDLTRILLLIGFIICAAGYAICQAIVNIEFGRKLEDIEETLKEIKESNN